jgi:hypothetical protein
MLSFIFISVLQNVAILNVFMLSVGNAECRVVIVVLRVMFSLRYVQCH